MNASDWEKAAALVNQHKHAEATAQTEQLSSMPLSALSLDDSGPPMVQYGLHVPLAANMPNSTSVHMHNLQQEHSYQEIIPGIPQGSLYPTLSSLSSDPVASATNEKSLHNRVIKALINIYKKHNSYETQKITTLMVLPDLQIHRQC